MFNALHTGNNMRVGISVTVRTCVPEALGSNVNRDTSYHDYFPGFPQYKYRDSIPMRSLSLPYKTSIKLTVR
jgi:hypothetical protein